MERLTKRRRVARRRREVILIEELALDVARDDRHTVDRITLLKRGYPGSRPPIHYDAEGNGPPNYPDLTGEWAITPDQATHMGHEYSRHIYAATKALLAADAIRRELLPLDTAREQVADPEQWCRNCFQFGHCAPRNGKRDNYCRWCIDVHAVWRFYPPKHVVDLHHGGQHAKIADALKAYKRAGR